MTDESNDTPGEEGENKNEEASTSGVDHMAEMAAAMAEDALADASADANTDADADAEDTMEDYAESVARKISGKDVNIDTLLKVPVSLAIEVGRTRMPLSELLDTQEGSLIELDRLLDDPLDILVNGALIAHGVVVLANERFGIQITDIISLQERARSL